MKVGSLVECIHNFGPLPHIPGMHALKFPAKGNIYTISEIITSPDTGRPAVKLMEFPNNDLPNMKVYFFAEYFRELEFPPAFEEEIHEILTAPIYAEI